MMPLFQRGIRHKKAHAKTPWADRPEKRDGEIREPTEITKDMRLRLAHRRYDRSEGFTPKCVKVLREPYLDEGGHLVIDVELERPANSEDRLQTLRLSQYGVVAYAEGGWSPGHYLAKAPVTSESTSAA